ncbi:hypothetical protein D7W82_39715 [Corallococcus sp. CA049B]|nr:hypothetical protein D7W82_39715 [Corallococcus sp. CA049B]
MCGGAPSSPPGTWRTRRKKARAFRRLHRLQKAARQPRADFELWYADGVHFNLLPVTRSMWRRKGQRLLVPTPGKNVRVGVVGAIRFPSRHFLFAYQPKSVTTALFLSLLEKLVARAKRTARRIVLVLDNGGPFTSHRAQAALEAARPQVRVLRLPAYTSETLNWIEGYWDELKSTYFSQMLTEQREEFYPQAVRLLHRLQRSGRLSLLAPRATP